MKVVAGEKTMEAQKLTCDNMLREIGYEPAGVVELVKRQRKGFACIRP